MQADTQIYTAIYSVYFGHVHIIKLSFITDQTLHKSHFRPRWY